MNNIDQEISIGGKPYKVSVEKPVVRYEENPILCSSDVNKVWLDPKHKVITVHNAGVTILDEKVIMLFRSHLRNGISVIGKAVSQDGVTGWMLDEEPILKPCTQQDAFGTEAKAAACIEDEAGGVEDPRISFIDGTYYVTYSAYHGTIKDRVRVSLATTTDFRSFVRHGPVLDHDMRNVVIFPDKIGGSFYALMRPNDSPEGDHTGGIFKEILLANTERIENGKWNIHSEAVMKQGGGPSAFSDKIGPGATPIKTRHGWLNIFHGVRKTMDGNPYVLGVAFHELENPANVRVCNIPVLFPTRSDCRIDEEEYVHVPNVVFTCGALRKDDGTIMIYYGGNDTVMNLAFSHEDVLAELCHRYPQEPHTGQPLYNL